MKTGRFVQSAISAAIRNLGSRRKQEARILPSFVEPLEQRMLLSVSPLTSTTGSISLTGNETAITNGETTPSLQNWTNFDGTSDDGTFAVTRTYTIQNATGAGTLTLIGSNPVTVTPIGGGVNYFSVTTQPSATIADGGTGTFTIQFNPTTTVATPTPEFATVRINSSDPAGAFTFEVEGVSLPVTKTSDGLEVAVTNPGRGAGAADDQVMVMNYAGYLTDGTLFDSSENAGRSPFEFELGVGDVIKGWDEGLLNAKVGESLTLLIPSSLGYGSSGQGSIPANATLIFDTTVLAIISANGQVTTTTNGQPTTSWAAINDGQATPSTSNATNFGTFSNSSAPVTNTYQILSPAGDLNQLLASTNPIEVLGSSAFTASAITYSDDNTVGTFTVTYTPTPGVQTAEVAAISALPGGAPYAFEIQATGPAADDGSATYVASTDDITGFAYNPSNLAATDSVKIVISNGPTQTVLADEASPELQNQFGSVSHDFTYAMPVLSVGTHTVSIYAVDGSVSTLIGTTSVTSQNSLFDDHYYLMENPDVSKAVAAGTFSSGYQHYIQYGQYENRSPSPYWNEAYYLSQNPDVAAAVKAGTVSSGFMQFYNYGQYENRPGLEYFNTSYYLSQNPDVAAAVTSGEFSSAFEHYVLAGQYEGRSPMLYFSSSLYDADNSDILPFVTGETFSSDFEQYVLFGQYEHRTASTHYSETTYLADNPDVAAAVAAGEFPDGLQHWLEYGQYEGRTAV